MNLPYPNDGLNEKILKPVQAQIFFSTYLEVLKCFSISYSI
jgi:hypothetical protein